MRAELRHDGAAAAADEEHFFRSPEFLAAEGAGHSLILDAGAQCIAIPVVVREIQGSDLRDAVSPYGYPGASGSRPKAPAADEVDWSRAGLVSVFVRDRLLGPPALAQPTERSLVHLHDPSRPRRVRPRLAEQIRGNEREGWAVERAAGPSASQEQRRAFATAYGETMRRVGAADRYHFDDAYLERIIAFAGTHLLLARNRDGAAGAGAIAAISDGVLHYFLGGTADAAIDASPFKNVVAALLDLADELGMPLNLGGGVEPGDGLERFKRGFANDVAPYRTHEVVADREAYEALAPDREVSSYFPAYRAA